LSSNNIELRAVSLKHDGTVKMANLPVPSVSDRRDRLSRLSVTDGTGRRLLKHDGTEIRSKNAYDVNDVKAKQTMICNAVRYVSFQVPGRQRV